MKNRISVISVVVVATFFLSFLAKGQSKNPLIYQNRLTQDMGGPFESSNSNSRYALVKAIVDNKTFLLNTDLAKFSSPDVSKSNGNYISIFSPGVSLLAIPLYSFGQYLHFPQTTVYLLNVLLALVNLFLIFNIVKNQKFGVLTALFSGGLFIFATNAFTYAGTLTQHHAITACLLSLLLIYFHPISIKNNLLFGIIWGLGLLMDIPFIIFSMPILLAFIHRHINFGNPKLLLRFNWKIIYSGLGLLIPIIIFGYYNLNTVGSVFKIAQYVGQSSDFRDVPATVSATPKSRNPFRVYKTRYLIQGLYTLILSNERSIFYYSPFLLIAIPGLIFYFRSFSKITLLPAFTSITLGVISYSMFGDPWGGWSFGPRYLIPVSAMLILFIPYALVKLNKFKVFSLIFTILVTVSVFINTLAVLTTNLVPPKQEAVNLVSPIPHTYKYNWQLINKGNTHSLLYILLFSKYLTPLNFYYIFAGSISLFLTVIYLKSRHENKSN